MTARQPGAGPGPPVSGINACIRAAAFRAAKLRATAVAQPRAAPPPHQYTIMRNVVASR